MLSDGTARAADLARIESEITAEVEEAMRFATDSPWPDPATVLDHVYSDGVGA